MTILRFAENPLIRPSDVRPSSDDLEVVCTFNCGCVRVGDQILLLLRVAERPHCEPDELVAPILHHEEPDRGVIFLRVRHDDPDVQLLDSRRFRYQGRTYLTSISHLRVARSEDGRHFSVEDKPALFPSLREEEYGIEDPRITPIDGTFYINYSVVSRYGVATALARTHDFEHLERLGVIFPPDNRDVTIFPEKIGGRYHCHHRPMAAMFDRADIWSADSSDLFSWGNHHFVCGCRPGMWDSFRVGGGAVPLKTERGWMSIYHGADQDQRYCLGLLLTDLEAPHRVLARSKVPLLAPEADYERLGFFGNVVFTCGVAAMPDGRVNIYYGASDQYTCGAETTLDGLLATLPG